MFFNVHDQRIESSEQVCGKFGAKKLLVAD